MQQSNKCASTQCCRWTFWVCFFLAAFVVNGLIYKYLGEFAVQILPVYIFVLIISVIYGRLLCCNRNSTDETILISSEDDRLSLSEANPIKGDCEEPQEEVKEEEQEKEEYVERTPRIDNTTSFLHLEGTELTDLSTDQSLPSRSRRLYYLDNVKVFLTVLVVSHHMTCAFGVCGGGAWPLIVGMYKNPFQSFGGIFTLLNQGYFMSLFFFISAYFTPSSYQRKGKIDFLKDKAKRLWIPAFFVFMVMAPLLLGFSMWFTGKRFFYLPITIHAWFLFWLLLFNLAYVNICGGDNTTVVNTNAEGENSWKLPGPFTRLWYGLGICGVGMIVVFTFAQGFLFYGMPLAPGSLTNDILFFMAGIVAKKNGWLEKDLKEQIAMPISLLRFMVVVEAVMMIMFFYQAEGEPLYNIPALMIGGMYCIDASLIVLDFFQRYMDIENRYTKFFSDAAYTVYIIHPIFVIGLSSLWIKGYESIFGQEIKWDDNLYFSETEIKGGSMTLGLSWLVSNILVHLFVWPAAYYLRKLPGLRQIL